MPIWGARRGGTRGLRRRRPTLHPSAPRPQQRLPAGPAPQAAGPEGAARAAAPLDAVRGGEGNGATERRTVGEGGSGLRARPPRAGQRAWVMAWSWSHKTNPFLDSADRGLGPEAKGRLATAVGTVVASGGRRRQHPGPMGRAAALGGVCWLLAEGPGLK